jgi:hypothetical protein
MRYVAGTYNGWQLQPMTYADGAWRFTAVPITRGAHRLKFADTPDFTGDDWGDAHGVSGIVRRTTGGDPDVRFEVDQNGVYDIVLDDTQLRYRISPSAVKTLRERLYVAGTFSDWQPLSMRFDGQQWILPHVQLEAGDHALKFLDTPDFSGTDWGGQRGRSGVAQITTGGGDNIQFPVPFADRYRIRFSDVSLEYHIAP